MGSAETYLLAAGAAVVSSTPREDLVETPARFADAMRELLSGYSIETGTILKSFYDPDASASEVVVRDLPFTSLCEHHLLPFSGTVDVGIVYSTEYPRVIGLSKFARLVEAFAHRLQMQERLTADIASQVMRSVGPAAVIVRIRAAHTCMCGRGVKATGSSTETVVRRLKAKPDEVEADRIGALLRRFA